MAKPDISTNGINSNQIYMPDELLRFIQRDTYSLLIKGFAGTGKTTLALTILRALESNNNFFYISTRISPKQLFQYYPWLDRFIEQPKDAGEGSSEHGLTPAFEDARLDEPESLFERITNQLMDIKSPIIIIDSWDAIASFMDKEARLNNERVLQTWRERAGAKLIFISEHPADTTLDFLVDGIVELKQSYYGSVKVREVFMVKLRGVRIDRPSYIYTLENSVFRSFAPYRPLMFQQAGKKPLSSDGLAVTANYVKSGYPVLDGALGGGLPKKGVVLLELDSHVNTAVAMAFLGRLVSNFLSSGNPVLFQPFDWVDPEAIMNYMNPYLPAGKKSLFKILWTCKVKGLADNMIVPLQKQYDNFSLAAVTAIKQKHPGKFLLNVMGTDIMQKSYRSPKDIRDGMEQLMSAARTSDLSIAVISRSQKDMLEYMSEVSDIHLRFLMINDTLFLQSLVPASTLYSVVFDEPDGHHINLEPIV
jgi:KaiC/GvpD/RAD55 family RecA-like ATPase